MSTLKQFINCRILRCGKLIKEDLWVRNGKIINPEKVFFDEKIQAAEQIDCKNAIISPGFIDLQINGKKESSECGLPLKITRLLIMTLTSYRRGACVVTKKKKIMVGGL